jgi:hypothetical protein
VSRGLDRFESELALSEHRTNKADRIYRWREAEERYRYKHEFDERLRLAAGVEEARHMKLQLRLGASVGKQH